jgi:hypothetical protein
MTDGASPKLISKKLSQAPSYLLPKVSGVGSSPPAMQRTNRPFHPYTRTASVDATPGPGPPADPTPRPSLSDHPMIALYNQYGNILAPNYETISDEKKTKEKDLSKDPLLYYMSINHPDEKAEIFHPYTLLNEEVQKLTQALKIIDTRNPDTETSSYLTDCLTIVRGLHVSKATTIDNVIEPLYAVCEGILWTVHNIHRVSKRVLAEMEMINIELRRRLDSTIDIKNLLRQKKNPEVSNDHIGDIVAAIARCLDAKLTFTWYKHNSSVSKHLTASRKAEVEGEMYTLIQLISTTPGIRALCKK